MSFLEFRQFWEVTTPLGNGKAIFLQHSDNDYQWTVVLQATGAIVTFPQSKLRIRRSYTQGIAFTDEEMRYCLAEAFGK